MPDSRGHLPGSVWAITGERVDKKGKRIPFCEETRKFNVTHPYDMISAGALVDKRRMIASMQHDKLTVGGFGISGIYPFSKLFGPTDTRWMGNHQHPSWIISERLFVFLFFSLPEYMLEPPIPDATNDQELLDGMTTTNVYVAKANQNNLDLGEDAISR